MVDYRQRLRDLREDKELKQADIAKILTTTQSQYSAYEAGKNKMKARHIKTLCVFYNVTADYLLGLIDEPRPLR